MWSATRPRLLAMAWLAVAAIPGAAMAATTGDQRVDASLGRLRVVSPTGQPAGVVALISDASGFDRDETDLADAFTKRGQLVIGISWRAFVHRQESVRRDCADLLGPLLGSIARIERDAGIQHYLTPVLAGLREGGSAARALSPAVTGHQIAGVVAIEAVTTLRTAAPLCGTIAHQRPDTVVYEGPSRSTPAALRELAGLDVRDAADAVQSLEAEAGPRGPGEIADLPLVVTRPFGPVKRLAVLLTGDGGLGSVDQDLGNALAGRGTLVATLDSRRYFWSTRDPTDLARDLQRVVHHFRREGAAGPIGVVGYSFGADVLPLAYAHLASSLRREVAVVSLISMAPAIDFRIEFDDADYPNAVPLLPAAARIDAPAVQCLYGADDPPAALACPALALVRPEIAVHRTSGGHGLDGDMEAVADFIVAPLQAAEAPRHRGGAWQKRTPAPEMTADVSASGVLPSIVSGPIR